MVNNDANNNLRRPDGLAGLLATGKEIRGYKFIGRLPPTELEHFYLSQAEKLV